MTTALVPLNESEARVLTDRIRSAAEEIWSLLLIAHERKAWSALGYATWEDYVRGEFDMSRAYAYRLLDQGRVVREIRAVSPDGDTAVTEAEARDIKPVLNEVTEEIRERVGGLDDPNPEQVKEVVRDVVNEKRKHVQQRRQKSPTNIPRSVMRALSDIDRARRSLMALDLAALARQDEEARRTWAANLSEHLEVLTRFRDTL